MNPLYPIVGCVGLPFLLTRSTQGGAAVAFDLEDSEQAATEFLEMFGAGVRADGGQFHYKVISATDPPPAGFKVFAPDGGQALPVPGKRYRAEITGISSAAASQLLLLLVSLGTHPDLLGKAAVRGIYAKV